MSRKKAEKLNEKPPVVPSPYAIQSVSIDFVTLTGTTEQSYTQPFAFIAGYVDQWRQAAGREFYQSRNGFRLHNIGSIAYGRRGEEWLISAWGPSSPAFHQACAPFARNCTRIDLQVTLKLEAYDGLEIWALYRERKATSSSGRPMATTLIESKPGGYSLYVGRRQSSQLGRIYDKWEQSKRSPAFANCIRFEVEYKKPLSKAVSDWILDEAPSDERMFQNVLGWFQERGIPLEEYGTFPESAIQRPVEAISPERSLEWLRNQVRPTYQQLVLKGFEYEANEALGILPTDIGFKTAF